MTRRFDEDGFIRIDQFPDDDMDLALSEMYDTPTLPDAVWSRVVGPIASSLRTDERVDALVPEQSAPHDDAASLWEADDQGEDTVDPDADDLEVEVDIKSDDDCASDDDWLNTKGEHPEVPDDDAPHGADDDLWL